MAEFELIKNLVDLGVAIALIMGGLKEWYVWGPQYREMKRQRDYYQSQVDGLVNALMEALKPPEASGGN